MNRLCPSRNYVNVLRSSEFYIFIILLRWQQDLCGWMAELGITEPSRGLNSLQNTEQVLAVLGHSLCCHFTELERETIM